MKENPAAGTKGIAISVVIPTFNRREIIVRSLATLFAQDFPADSYEVIVVVDGSTDGTVEALQCMKPPCGFRVLNQENRGPSAARNKGWRAAESSIVLFLDDDMFCDPGLLSAHLAAHQDHSKFVVLGRIALSSDSPSTLSAECFNHEIGRFHLEHANHSTSDWKETDCVFSNTSIARALLCEFGGFDESFRMREDMELGIRLFRAGVRPIYVSGATAHQYYTKTTADLLRDAEAFAAADLMIMRKHDRSPIKDQVNALGTEPRWKATLRMLAVKCPGAADFLLTPLCATGQILYRFSPARRMGVHALKMRRRIHWLHALLKLEPGALKKQSN